MYALTDGQTAADSVDLTITLKCRLFDRNDELMYNTLQTLCTVVKNLQRLLKTVSPSPPVDIIGAMMTVWRIRGKTSCYATWFTAGDAIRFTTTFANLEITSLMTS